MKYDVAQKIVDTYQEIPGDFVEQVKLYRMAGFRNLHTHLGKVSLDRVERNGNLAPHLFRAAQNTFAQAQKVVENYHTNLEERVEEPTHNEPEQLELDIEKSIPDHVLMYPDDF